MSNDTPATVGQTAPGAQSKSIERQGGKTVPYVQRFPEVRGGVCEYCGILDNTFGDHQYKLCPHYRGMALACSYCDEAVNPDDVTKNSVLNVYTHPDNPNKLVVVCDRYDCVTNHRKRFEVNS